MSSLGVQTISVDKTLCPIFDTTELTIQCSYSPQGLEIWNLNTTKPIPVTLSPSNSAYELQVKVVAPKPGNYSLQAILDEQQISQPAPLVASTQGQSVTGTATIKLITPKLPSIFKGKVLWTLSSTDPDLPKPPPVTTQTDIEVYALTPKLPAFFDQRGIPLALLRSEPYMSEWKRDTETDWAKYVIQKLFNDSRMEYEVGYGSAKYTNVYHMVKSSGQDPPVVCWIELWLSDMNGLSARKDNDSRYAVNCQDLAVLAWTIISLGVDYTQIRFAYLAPYGYIKPTHLIGRKELITNPKNPDNLCNNPFYGLSGYCQDMLCVEISHMRSKFSNHMFLLQRKDGDQGQEHWNVLDATAGPQLGTVSVFNYIQNSIDLAANLYQPPKNRPGTFNDFESYQGVSNLAASVAFQKSIPDVNKDNTLLGVFAKEFEQKGTLQTPFIGASANGKSVTATFTFNFQIADTVIDTVIISFSRFQVNADMKNAFMRRRALLMSLTDLSSNDMLGNACSGGLRVFYHDAWNVLVVIDTLKITSTAHYMNKMKEWIWTCCEQLKPAIGYAVLQDPLKITSSSTTVTLGSEFSITIEGDPARKDWWKSYRAVVSNGAALLLSSSTKIVQIGNISREDITFLFLARQAGLASIKLDIFGPNLDRQIGQCAVFITAA